MRLCPQSWSCGKPISKKWKWHGVVRCSAGCCFKSSNSANATQLPCTTIEFTEMRHFKMQTLRCITSGMRHLRTNTVPTACNTLRPCDTSKTATMQIATCTHCTTLLHRLCIATHIRNCFANTKCELRKTTIRKQYIAKTTKILCNTTLHEHSAHKRICRYTRWAGTIFDKHLASWHSLLLVVCSTNPHCPLPANQLLLRNWLD